MMAKKMIPLLSCVFMQYVSEYSDKPLAIYSRAAQNLLCGFHGSANLFSAIWQR